MATNTNLKKTLKQAKPDEKPAAEDEQAEVYHPGPDPWGNINEAETTDEDDNATWVNIKRVLKVIPRDNPNDPFKPHSVQAVHDLTEQGASIGVGLTPGEEEFIQNYAADMDVDTPFDKTDPPAVSTDKISRESKIELAKLPSWLRSFIESKFGEIHAKYGNNTHIFIQMFATRLNYRKTKRWTLLPNDQEMDEIHRHFDDDLYGEVEGVLDKELQKEHKDPDPFKTQEILKVSPEENNLELWSPLLMQQAADALRAVLLAGASDSEGEDPRVGEWEDDSQKLEEMRSTRKSFMFQKDDESIYKGPHWEDVVARKQRFAEKARWETTWEFTPLEKKKRVFFESCRRIDNVEKEVKDPEKSKSSRKKKPDKPRKNNAKSDKPEKETETGKKSLTDFEEENENSQEDGDDEDWEDELDAELEEGCCKTARLHLKYYSTEPGHPLYRKPMAECERRARHFRERGVGKRASRVYLKDPCKGPVTRVTRELHQVRPTEGIHAYVNFITASIGFRYFILVIIMFNAVLLAAETGEQKDRRIFDFFDSIFLSIYLVEFILKCYSNPLQYFRSGFNLFDFVILVCSLTKAIMEWTGVGQKEVWFRKYGRYFIIIRAMRVLRGVSLSVHTQVLVIALVETLKNHVLSVMVLLVLLMYIAAIVAYHLFADVESLNLTWGTVPQGMLRLFAFVTMDGWTEIMDEFEKADKLHGGRLFCMVCIVFGNFVFSNIFIAIIIMQISEATEKFRKRQTDELESSVFLKQESVFRRQQLDMRQLLSRHKLGLSDDFYEIGSRFVRRLRHDDLVDTREIIFSPMWMDSFYKASQRAHHTSNVLMNLHRKTSDRLVKLNNLYNEGKSVTRGISRARYNRYLDVKARLALLKQQFLDLRKATPKQNKIKLPDLVSTQEHAQPPPRPPPLPKSLRKRKERKSRKSDA